VKKIALGLLLAALVAAGGYGAWYCYRQQNMVTIVFADALGLVPDAGVWMTGLEIGKVEQVRLADDGVEVTVFIRPAARKQLTDKALFVIDPGLDKKTSPIVRVKAGPPGGGPLQGGTKIRGMNSLALWEVSDFPERLKEFMNEPQLKEGLRQLDELGQELQHRKSRK
jgi:hypothetical protein